MQKNQITHKTFTAMQQHEMKGIFGLLGTTFLYIISRFTVAEWASIATIFAAMMTGIFYLIKWIKLLRNKN